MEGRIHSFDSCGLVDGPGIRFIVFFQGCSLRCLYCHNPDTWNQDGGFQISTEELIQKIIKFKPYFDASGGGVTCSGGEPLLQPKFLIELFKQCKERGIGTALDTAGFGVGHYEEILKYTDIVLLDIKHSSEEGYINLTGRNLVEFNKFKQALNEYKGKLIIRHVVVPDITDNLEHLYRLKNVIQSFNKVHSIELLPYHNLGINKYENLNIPYPLKDKLSMDLNKMKYFKSIFEHN